MTLDTCAKCGGALFLVGPIGIRERYQIACHKCGADTAIIGATEEHATLEWNRAQRIIREERRKIANTIDPAAEAHIA